MRAWSCLHHFRNQEAEEDGWRCCPSLFLHLPSPGCQIKGWWHPQWVGFPISIYATKTAFCRRRRLDPQVILDSVKVTITTNHHCLLLEERSFEIPVVTVLCIKMDFSSSLALSLKPGMLHMQNSLLLGSSWGFAEFFFFFCRAQGKQKNDIFDHGWSQIFAYLCNPPLPHLAVWLWRRKPAALGEQISWASLVSKFNLLCCVNISDLSGALERLMKVSKEQGSVACMAAAVLGPVDRCLCSWPSNPIGKLPGCICEC